MAEYIKKLFKNNADWVERIIKEDPEFFSQLGTVHTPEVLWIGCSDARVPADQITGTLPGEIFVHRNIANLVVHTDLNILSVLSFAVEVLKVRHIVVCGHYECGGIRAALTNKSYGLIDNWLRNIKDVYSKNREELNAIADEGSRNKRLVELNIKQQVLNLIKTSIVQTAWNKSEYPYIHGWVYDVHDGRLKDLGVTFNSNTALSPIFRFEE